MSKIVQQLVALSEEHLEAGEGVVAGVRVNQKGASRAAAGGAVGGLLGAAVAHKMTKGGREAQAAAGFPPNAQLAFALTDRRLLVFDRGAMSGRPKRFLTSMPLSDIVSVRYEPAKLVPRIHLGLASGAEVGFEAVRLDDPEHFAAALDAALAPAT